MPGVALGITLPTVGVTAGPTYATDTNTALQIIIDDIEDKIVLSEIDVTQNWSFRKDGTSYAITDMDYLKFQTRSSDPDLTGVVYTKEVSGVVEVFYDDGTNPPFALTSGGSLNSGAIAGIAGPGYGDDGELITWVDAADRYDFFDGPGANAMASIAVSEVLLRDGSDALTLDVDTLSGDITWLLPADLPASGDKLLQIDNSGNVDHVTTFAPEGGTLTVTGTLAASVDIDATADMSCVDLVATGDVAGDDLLYTGTRITCVYTAAAALINATRTSDGIVNMDATNEEAQFPIVLPSGTFISSINVYGSSSTGTTLTVQATLSRANKNVAWSEDAVDFAILTLTGADADPQTFEVADINHTMDSDYYYWLKIEITAFTAGDFDLTAIDILHTRPA